MGNAFGNIKDLQTDEVMETEGIDLAFGNDRFITIARAGGANRKYRTTLSALAKPHKSAMERGSLDEKTATEMMHKVYARAVVLDWRGWADAEGNPIPCTEENIIALFEAAPTVFDAVRDESDKFSNFTTEEVKEAGNE